MASYGGQAGDGIRAARLQKDRERDVEEANFKKRKLADSLKVGSMDSKFSANYDAIEEEIKASTVGLQTHDQLVKTQERVVKEREKQMSRKENEKKKEERDRKRKKDERKNREKRQIKSLSFDPENEDEDEENEEKEEDDENKESDDKDVELSRKRFGMNPGVETHFLPDRERDEAENDMRVQLGQEWETNQKMIKQEEVEITYSYWDGSGHRKTTTMKKGNTIYQFLVKVLESIRQEFPELKTVTADALMYVKEDLIIPQTNTFYDFIVSRARGKSGPLFSFDAHEDVRMISDARIEKDESHAGKVVIRSWYERNKHIFPASRWEPYDPTKSYEKYSVADKKEKDPGALQFMNTGTAKFANNDAEKEPEEENILKKLSMGSQSGCRSMCKCTKSAVCEMHYQKKKF